MAYILLLYVSLYESIKIAYYKFLLLSQSSKWRIVNANRKLY
jgi:hypothetical protein